MLSKNIRAWLALAFSAGLFFALPSLAVSNEHKGAPQRFVDGTLEIVHIDEVDQGKSRFAYYLLTAEGDGPGNSGAAFELRFERPPPPGLATGDRLNVRGRAVGRNLWVEDIAAADQEGSADTPEENLVESSVTDPRSAIVMLVNIAGTTTWTNSHITTAENAMFYASDSVDNIYADASFNQTGFPDTHGTVVAPVTITKQNGCPVYDYAAAADAAASAAGANLNQYQHRVYIIPGGSVSDCDWLALGVLGSYGSNSMLRSWSTIIDTSALAHELGHNVGWHHAATDPNNNGFNQSESGDVEYGDQSDTMGYCCVEKKFNAVHMDQIGWYDDQPTGTMLTVAGSGNYTLVPLGTDPNSATGPQILKVSKPDTGEVYYLSYRQKVGLDTNISTTYTTGVNIHHAPETGRWSYFIDALADGEVFNDTVNGLSIVQNSHDPNGVNITISYDSCLPANPSVSVTPSPQMIDLMTTISVAYNVTVSNNDSQGCNPSAFELDTTLGALAGGTTGPVSPGTSSAAVQLTMDETDRGLLSDGNNFFTVDATRGAHTGAGSGNLIADEMPPSEPSNPTAIQKKVKGQQSVQVTWGASTDTASGVDEYRISRSSTGETGTYGQIGTTTSLKFVDTNAAVSDPYFYEITAVDDFDHVSTPAQVAYVPGGGGGGGPGNGNGNGRGNGKK